MRELVYMYPFFMRDRESLARLVRGREGPSRNFQFPCCDQKIPCFLQIIPCSLRKIPC
jgi:hypothetical protein